MKNSIKKFVLACAAVTAVTAVSATAMAADLGTVSYDDANNNVTITLPADVKADAEATVLVLNKGVTLETLANDSDILYVNQATGGDFDGDETTTEVLKLLNVDGGLADGTYAVEVGYYNADGNFQIAEGTFTLGAAYTKGDVNDDTYINGSDAAAVIDEFLTPGTLTDTQKLAADVNGDGMYNGTDAAAIIDYFLKGSWD
jgi:hypothetical protein